MKTIFDDWRHRWSQLCVIGGRWHVIVGYEPRVGWPKPGYPIVRPVHWWSPRDWLRFPLHLWWERRYW